MRFIKKELITTTIVNKDLTDAKIIRKVFKNLHDYGIAFTLTINQFDPVQYEHFNINYEKARVIKINDDETLLQTLSQTLSLNKNSSTLKDELDLNKEVTVY